MNINQLILIIEKKLKNNIVLEDLKIEDKTFLHTSHQTYQEGKFHIKLTIASVELKNINKIKSTKKIYSILEKELKEHIHSIQVLIN